VEGKAADITKPGKASVKAFVLPERVRDETRVGISEGAFRSMRLVDLLHRTAVYVVRMYGGVGGEEPRGSPLSRLNENEKTEIKKHLASVLRV